MLSHKDIKVLIIDDIDSVKKIIRPTLVNQLGFTSNKIYETYNGRQALELLNTTQFDLILCEWNIPGITGIELLRHIRKHPTLSTIPFVMITSNSDQRYILEAAEAKVSQYVIKPFTADSFAVKLDQALQSKERRTHPRHEVTKSNELTVLVKGKPYTSGATTNISKGGLLAKLIVQRGLTIYDKLELRISISDTSTGENFLNLVNGELIRIEQNTECADKKTAYYAFRFTNLDQKQKEFLERLTLWIGQKKPAKQNGAPSPPQK